VRYTREDNDRPWRYTSNLHKLSNRMASISFNRARRSVHRHCGPDSPNLYTAITEVYRDTNFVDRVETKFSVRSISFDTTNGLMLNGKPLKLKGACLHHDNGPLGARAFDRAEERRVELLKASGYNALRLAHNPPSPPFLEACDRLGMMVIDEAFDMWREGKNPHDYPLFFD
jgi:beta-galactosidase